MNDVNTATSQDLWDCTSALGSFVIFPSEFLASTIPPLCFVLDNKHVAAILVYQPGRILLCHISPNHATSCLILFSPSVESSVLQACILLSLPLNWIGLSGNASYLHAGLRNLTMTATTLITDFHGFPQSLKANTGTVPKIRLRQLPPPSFPIPHSSSCKFTPYFQLMTAQ
jgi:hypothetical protein